MTPADVAFMVKLREHGHARLLLHAPDVLFGRRAHVGRQHQPRGVHACAEVAVREQLASMDRRLLQISKERVSDDTALKDLVSESFVLVELAIELQEDFRVRFSQEDLKVVRSVTDLVALIDSRKKA